MTRPWLAALYVVVVALCWTVPPLATLHYPAGVVWAATAFFGSGWFACRLFSEQRTPDLLQTLKAHLPLLLIPLVGLLVPGLWRTHCDLVAGFGYFLLFPLSSALFATALAYWITSRTDRYAGWRFTGVGLLVIVGGTLYDLGLHPQFYTYSHVFGGVLAPIYDRFLPFHPGLIAFRGVTLLWVALLWARGHAVRYGWSLPSAGVAGPVALALAAAYLFSGELRINTTTQTLQQSLQGHHPTAHFDVYYDPADLDSTEVATIGDELEFERDRLIHDLGAGSEAPAGIRVYLYPDADTRARLTGAHTTSVAPVWLAQPQMHLLTARYASMPHELAHIMTRPYGLPLVNASWSVGLVEGWAVALEAPTRRPHPHDQVLAVTPFDALPDRATQVKRQWSPVGFWTARGGASYTVFGSFIQSVADQHGHPAIADAYASGRLADATGCPFEALTDSWIHDLRTQPHVNVDARPVAQRRFRIPSFFELDCPYEPVPAQARYDEAQDALATGDTTAALGALHAALDRAPGFARSRHQLARLYLDQQRPDSVYQVLGDADARGPTEWMLAATAHMQLDRWAEAARAYRAAETALPRASVEARTRLTARALDADAAAAVEAPAPDSTWQQRLRTTEQALHTDSLNLRAERDAAIATIQTSDLPRGWRDTWTLHLHLTAVASARDRGDWPLAQRVACEARAAAKRQNAPALKHTLAYTARRAHWHQTGTIGAACPSEPGR